MKQTSIVNEKLNRRENIISKPLIDHETSHEGFAIIVNEADKYSKLTKSIEIMKNDIERDKLINDDEIMKMEELVIINSLNVIIQKICFYLYI